MAELLHNPAKYRKSAVTVFTDNLSTTLAYQGQRCKKLYMAFFLEALNYITAALQVSLSIKWLRRRSSYPMDVADDATHSDFSHVEPGTLCARHSLPPPLQEVLLGTTSYMSHQLGTLRSKVKSYLLTVIPDLRFPH